MKKHNPIVSIVLISYNSEKYILETLESIKNQTFPQIDLIVTDDASTDNTVAIVKSWLEANNSRFVRNQLIVSPINTGISPNCNRGFDKSMGQWVKLIAGDDILLPNCITDFMDYVSVNKQAKIVCSELEYMIINKYDFNIQCKLKDQNQKLERFAKMTCDQQLKYFIRSQSNFIPAPTLFYNNTFFKLLGGFDERYKMLEDMPFLIRTLLNKEKIYLLKKKTVNYRVGSGVSQVIPGSINASYFEDKYRFFRNEIFPLLEEHKYFLSYWDRMIYFYITRKIVKNKYNDKNIPIRLKILKYLNPKAFTRILRERIVCMSQSFMNS